MNLNNMQAHSRDAQDLRLAAARGKPRRGNSLLNGQHVMNLVKGRVIANENKLLSTISDKFHSDSSSNTTSSTSPTLVMRNSSSATKYHNAIQIGEQRQATNNQFGSNFLINTFVCQRLSTNNCGSRRVGNEHKRDTAFVTLKRGPKRFGSCHSSIVSGSLPSTSLSSLLFAPTSSSFLSSLALIMSVLLMVLMLLVGQMPLRADGIKLQPDGKEKFYWSGDTFVITCQNNNNIKNVKIRWIGPSGAYISEDRAQRVHAESSGPHGHRLVVMNATVGADEGQYRCTIGSTDDRSPRETSGFQLRLFQSASFKDTARRLVLPTGQTGTLSCRVEFEASVSSASVQWMRDQRPIELLNDSAIRVLDYEPSQQLSQLIISPVSRHHEGRYTCRALAVTTELSKVSDLDIELEINYAPQFEPPLQQVVWVESSQSLASRSLGSAAPQPGPKNVFGPGGRNHRLMKHPFELQMHQQMVDGPEPEQPEPGMVRVELRCSCQANPPASILWRSTSNSKFVLQKGAPSHVLEEPRLEVNGHNSSSLLVIGYKLDPNWPFRRESYICSASNKLGDARKSFTIEQGNPPPAFNVAPNKAYNPQTFQFRFTLLGPNFSPDSTSSAGGVLDQQEIVPPVDAFRIRAESAGPSAAGGHSGPGAGAAGHRQHSDSAQAGAVEPRTSYARRQLDPSVQWTLEASSAPARLQEAHNFTVNLGRLPSGSQRLFLEAHNAVGWSPNATYLGDFYLVSSASSSAFGHQLASTGRSLLGLLVLQLIASLSISLALNRDRNL